MTTLPDRDQAALLVIDVQNGVVEDAHDREAVIDRIGTLVERARLADVPVIWIQHSDEDLPVGSEEWKYVQELAPVAGEALIAKSYGDAFEETSLEDVLAEHGVGQLFVVGAQTDQCIRSTLHGAITRGYDATLVADAHTTIDFTSYGAPPPADVIAHTNLYWTYHEAPGRVGGTVKTEELKFGSAKA